MKRSCIRLLSLWLAAACALSGCAGPVGTQDSSAPAETAASSSSGSTQSEETPTVSESSVPSADGFYTLAAEDTKVSCDPAELTASVTLSGFSASVEGTGVKVEGQTVTVTEGGTYSFKGSLSDGQIVVDTEKGEVVRLILDGVSITCSDGAPIFGKQAAKIIVTLTEGSEFSIATGGMVTGGLTVGGSVEGLSVLTTFTLSGTTTYASENGAAGGWGQMMPGGGGGGGHGGGKAPIGETPDDPPTPPEGGFGAPNQG